MKVWFTSDPHFWHKNIIRLCNRPFSCVEEMHEQLIARWNNVVSDEDTVHVLGDVFFCGAQKAHEVLNQLKGKKILVRGNHDKFTLTKLKSMFSEVHQQLKIHVGDKAVTLCHYPFAPTTTELGVDLRYMERRPMNDGSILLHGHVHNSWVKKGTMINVGVDKHSFTPVSEERILELINHEGDIP